MKVGISIPFNMWSLEFYSSFWKRIYISRVNDSLIFPLFEQNSTRREEILSDGAQLCIRTPKTKNSLTAKHNEWVSSLQLKKVRSFVVATNKLVSWERLHGKPDSYVKNKKLQAGAPKQSERAVDIKKVVTFWLIFGPRL